MADKQNPPPMTGNFFYFSKALFLKFRVSYCQNFINDKNIRLKVGRNGKGQTNIHAATIALYRCIKKFLNLSKRNYFIKSYFYFTLAHSQYRPIKENIFPA